jgi:hypothetical protein
VEVFAMKSRMWMLSVSFLLVRGIIRGGKWLRKSDVTDAISRLLSEARHEGDGGTFQR